jgi:hypothetical protein
MPDIQTPHLFQLTENQNYERLRKEKNVREGTAGDFETSLAFVPVLSFDHDLETACFLEERRGIVPSVNGTWSRAHNT